MERVPWLPEINFLNSLGIYVRIESFENEIIDISYSERGRVSEIDSDFEITARKFIEGLKLKKKK